MGLESGVIGRPPLAIGTAGAIRCYRTDTGYRARALTRDYDGRVRAVERRGKTRPPPKPGSSWPYATAPAPRPAAT